MSEKSAGVPRKLWDFSKVPWTLRYCWNSTEYMACTPKFYKDWRTKKKPCNFWKVCWVFWLYHPSIVYLTKRALHTKSSATLSMSKHVPDTNWRQTKEFTVCNRSDLTNGGKKISFYLLKSPWPVCYLDGPLYFPSKEGVLRVKFQFVTLSYSDTNGIPDRHHISKIFLVTVLNFIKHVRVSI